MRATSYSLRNTTGQKIVGGSLGMSKPIDMNEGAKIVAAKLGVAISKTGRVHFTRNGAEVSAYLSLDAGDTLQGRVLLTEWNRARERSQAEICPCCNQTMEVEQ